MKKKRLIYSTTSPHLRCQQAWSPLRAVREGSVPDLFHWLTYDHLLYVSVSHPSPHLALLSLPTIVKQHYTGLHKKPSRVRILWPWRVQKCLILPHHTKMGFPGGSGVKNPPASAGATGPGRQAFISSGSKEARSALESRRVSLGAHWVD